MKEFKFNFVAIWILVIAILPGIANGNTPDKNETNPWKSSGTINASGSLNQYEDWQAGGTDSISLGVLLDFSVNYHMEKIEWKNAFKVEYGTAKVEGEDSRKSADILELESILTYDLLQFMSIYGRFAGSTMMTRTYQYYDDPVNAIFDNDREMELEQEKIQTADAVEPLNLDQGTGLSFQMFRNKEDTKHLIIRVGAGARQLIASNYYVEDDNEDTEFVEFTLVDDYSEIGLESGLDFKWTFSENALLTSSVNAFYGFDEEFWKVGWDTSLNFKISKYFNAGIASSMVYDELVYDDPQWKTSTLLTFSYLIF